MGEPARKQLRECLCSSIERFLVRATALHSRPLKAAGVLLGFVSWGFVNPPRLTQTERIPLSAKSLLREVRLAGGSGALRLLKPLLLDLVPSIQQTAALALGRLAGHSEALASECVAEDVLPSLTQTVAQHNVSLTP